MYWFRSCEIGLGWIVLGLNVLFVAVWSAVFPGIKCMEAKTVTLEKVYEE
jgi:hypothetical protein